MTISTQLEKEEKMKKYLGLALSLALLCLANVGPAFASGSFNVDSPCYDKTYPVNCGGRTITITVTSVGGFSGTVTLTTQVTTYCTNCSLAATLNPTSIFIPLGGSNTSALSISHTCHTSISQPNCQWNVNVKGTSGSTTNSTDVCVCYGSNCPI